VPIRGIISFVCVFCGISRVVIYRGCPSVSTFVVILVNCVYCTIDPHHTQRFPASILFHWLVYVVMGSSIISGEGVFSSCIGLCDCICCGIVFFLFLLHGLFGGGHLGLSAAIIFWDW
jgi:hypothetical protein